MKLYAQADFDANRREKRRQIRRALILALPFFAMAIAAFVLRIELLCIAGFVIAGSILIFLYDLRIKPALRYGRYLAEAHSGLTRQTVGALVRIGSDPVYQDGVNFHEVILNIYEDMAEEGERRFLLDVNKEIPQDWIGQDVVVTSHGSFLLDVAPVEKKA
ncbi:MAG: hypothetical protein MSP08_01210 [Clostridiales bacterium]|nr:hypothetical protein [Clostridiales bacterium]MDY3762704.1 hypothetical protein [Candidatus Ventricola sp.]MCI6588530.1 hypothetical protein [Clostridiales bacterium]MCI7702947.1 hypothetical protein [Clostridiales bacterium]MDY3833091.1 hypothetical protein [Candidatus Ventricola sp.]